MEVLEKRKLTRLSDLISEAGLKKSLEQANDITILVPTNEAFSVRIKYFHIMSNSINFLNNNELLYFIQNQLGSKFLSENVRVWPSEIKWVQHGGYRKISRDQGNVHVSCCRWSSILYLEHKKNPDCPQKPITLCKRSILTNTLISSHIMKQVKHIHVHELRS